MNYQQEYQPRVGKADKMVSMSVWFVPAQTHLHMPISILLLLNVEPESTESINVSKNCVCL